MKTLMLVLVITSLFFSGCSQPIKTVYVSKPCPKLKQWNVEEVKVSYKVIEEVNDG